MAEVGGGRLGRTFPLASASAQKGGGQIYWYKRSGVYRLLRWHTLSSNFENFSRQWGHMRKEPSQATTSYDTWVMNTGKIEK